MSTKLHRYYMKKLYGGRSFVARLIDFIIFRGFLLLTLFVVLLYLSRSTLVALLVSILLTVAVSLSLSLIKRKRADRFMKKDMQRIKQKCLLENLTLMDLVEYSKYIVRMFKLKNESLNGDWFIAQNNEAYFYVFHNHPKSTCGVTEVLNAYRQLNGKSKIVIVSLSEFDDEAKMLCRNLQCDIELISGKKVLSIADKLDMLPDEETAKEKAEHEMNDAIITMNKVKKNAFSRTKVKGYVFCGIAIMFWPLITGFKFYYPVIALACFTLAVITYRKNRKIQVS